MLGNSPGVYTNVITLVPSPNQDTWLQTGPHAQGHRCIQEAAFRYLQAVLQAVLQARPV